MALTDFWQVKDNQTYFGKPVLNVYHVKRIDVAADAIDVALAYRDWLLVTLLPPLQPVGLLRTTIEVENLGDVTDFSSIDSSAFPGTIIANNLPSFNAATIQYNRLRTDMKNGSKRLLAGTEQEQDGGDWVAGFITLLQALAAKVMDPWEHLTQPGIDQVEFCVLKRFCVVPLQDPCLKYRLPNTDAEIDNNHYVPTTALVRARVRSQTSRKILI